jgi:protocatechuate 3,4-dioxygenase beta subunit
MLRAMNDSDQLDSRRGLRRRDALTALGGLGLTGIVGGGASALLGSAGPAQAAGSCVLSPEVTEGPYWVDGTLTRRDIREGKPGLPLEVVFTVQDAKTCHVISGADVEIWHCDAVGEYSGFDGAGHAKSSTRYLRGHQKTSASGVARFLTVFPGWYSGRTPHIHLKVHVGGSVVHTGQVFFNEQTTAAVYRKSPYKSHGQPDTRHAADNIFKQAGGSKAQLQLTRRTKGRAGYRGAITLGVAT